MATAPIPAALAVLAWKHFAGQTINSDDLASFVADHCRDNDTPTIRANAVWAALVEQDLAKSAQRVIGSHHASVICVATRNPDPQARLVELCERFLVESERIFAALSERREAKREQRRQRRELLPRARQQLAADAVFEAINAELEIATTAYRDAVKAYAHAHIRLDALEAAHEQELGLPTVQAAVAHAEYIRGHLQRHLRDIASALSANSLDPTAVVSTQYAADDLLAEYLAADDDVKAKQRVRDGLQRQLYDHPDIVAAQAECKAALQAQKVALDALGIVRNRRLQMLTRRARPLVDATLEAVELGL